MIFDRGICRTVPGPADEGYKALRIAVRGSASDFADDCSTQLFFDDDLVSWSNDIVTAKFHNQTHLLS
jgi:hypothetical protein